MKKNPAKSRRGRKPGQEIKLLHQNATLEQNHEAAVFGNYGREAFNAVSNFDDLCQTRKRLMLTASRTHWLAKAGLPPHPDDPSEYEECEIFPALPCARARASRSIHDLLDAVERRDVNFFKAIARRLESLGEESASTAASKVSAALVEYKMRQEESLNPILKGFRAHFQKEFSVEELRQIVRADYPKDTFDDRTLRRAAGICGYKLRPRGRPKKSGN